MKKVNVLFVCTGNICRSPMAEVVFRNIVKRNRKWWDKRIPKFHVASAGTDATNGEPVNDYSITALYRCGEKLPRQRMKSTRFSRQMLTDYDYIVCMTLEHKLRLDPRGKFDNVISLGFDIPDPWGHGIERYVDCCKKLQPALRELYKTILQLSNSGVK